MIIGLDHDSTYDLDKLFWNEVVTLAKSHGHKVVCVTCRQYTEENVAECDVPGVLTYFTSGSPKRWFMEQRGIQVDCWIDDSPESIVHGR